MTDFLVPAMDAGGAGVIVADVLEDHLDTARQSIHRIERLTADIMTVARIDSGTFSYELRPTDLTRSIETAARAVSGATQRHIEIDRPDRLPDVLADPERQLQVLTNLLTNAVTFSPEGSLVTVSVTVGDDAVAVHVRDEGIGIAADGQGLDVQLHGAAGLTSPPGCAHAALAVGIAHGRGRWLR